MTEAEVRQLVNSHSHGHLGVGNDHRITLKQALVPPERISITVQNVRIGRVTEMSQYVWLVGKEPSQDGYRIVMREDGLQFGLASPGFPSDQRLSLTGWYGGLVSAFLAM